VTGAIVAVAGVEVGLPEQAARARMRHKKKRFCDKDFIVR
jgi:hypothetical protein